MATTLKERYNKLSTGSRTQFLQRARHNALLTLPSLVPLDGHSGTSHLIEPHQGLGSLAVTHLASRLSIALLPAGRPAIRLDLPPAERMKSNGQVDPEIEKGLALSETLVQAEIESANWRSSTLQSMLQLIVAGNVLEHVQEDNKIRIWRLDQYVVRRAHDGTPIEIIIEDVFNLDSLPEDLTPPQGATEDQELMLYTSLKLIKEENRKFYQRTQEFEDEAVGGTTNWEFDEFPYFALRWSSTPGEDYGRAKVEEHAADLRSLDILEKGMLEQAAMASRNFTMIRPGATALSLKNRLTRALNGDVMVGNPEDVELKSFENSAGYQLTAAQVQQLRESIGKAFLLLSATQRQAERVTAAEIERDVGELEAALGGVFSMLNTEMMEGRIAVLIKNMQITEKLPVWEKDQVHPVVLTGLEALSRERDVGRAMQAGQVVQAFGDEAVDIVKLDRILKKALLGLGFADAINSQQETDQIRQQRAQLQASQQAAGQALPAVAREVARNAGQQGGQ